MFKIILTFQLLHILTLSHEEPDTDRQLQNTPPFSPQQDFLAEILSQLHPPAFSRAHLNKNPEQPRQNENDGTTFSKGGLLSANSPSSPQNLFGTSEHHGKGSHTPFIGSRNDHDYVTPSTDDTKLNQHQPRKLKRTRFPRSSNSPPFLSSHHQLHEKAPEAENHLREVFLVDLGQSTRKKRINSQNFTLCVHSGRILLYHNGEVIVDLTTPRKMRLTVGDIMLYESGLLLVSLGNTEATHYPNIKTLTVFKGTEVYTLTPTRRPVTFTEVAGELFVYENRAFYSLNHQFNAILESELARIASNNHSRFKVEFRSPADHSGSILSINGIAIIIVSDAEQRMVSSGQLLAYRDGTLYLQRTPEEGDNLEIFPLVEHLFLLSPTETISSTVIKKYIQSSHDVIRGGGMLYVHKATRTAFFSTEPSVNSKVSRFLSSLNCSEPVFSIRFQACASEGLFVKIVILANGEDILTLNADQIVDQSVAPQHHLIYANTTASISDGSHILHTTEGIQRLIVHSSYKLTSYTSSSAQPIEGGGQFFACKGLGFYSHDATLNDRIGDALLVAEAFRTPSSLPFPLI